MVLISLLGFASFSCLHDRIFPSPTVESPIDTNAKFTLVINEIMADGNPDWIEFYNFGTAPVSIKANEVFMSDAVSSPEKFVVDKDLVVAPKQYIVLECLEVGGIPSEGIHLFTDAFRLSGSGEAVSLKYTDHDLSLVSWADSVTFPEIRGNKSFARVPDGASTFSISNNPTKGQPNKP